MIYRYIKTLSRLLYLNLYVKPKSLLKLIISPTKIYGHNYYPEREQKSKLHIFFDQVVNIMLYGYINDYYYLYGLNIKNFRKKEDYVDYKNFMRRRNMLNIRNNHNSSCILRNKLYFGIFANALGIDTAENIAHIRNNEVLILKERRRVDLDEFISSANGDFFCKPLDGECGLGVFKLSIKDGNIYINETLTEINDFKKELNKTDYLIQCSIKQHQAMDSLHTSSINSIRLVTVRSLRNNKIVPLPSILRIGTNGSIVDNTSQGGVAIGFNLETGQLNEYGFQKPQFGSRLNTHPNSQIKFSTFHIPHIQEAINQAKYFHSFLDMHSIGWDIAIGENGPIFIEGNDNWEINGPQSCNGGLMRKFKEYFYTE